MALLNYFITFRYYFKIAFEKFLLMTVTFPRFVYSYFMQGLVAPGCVDYAPSDDTQTHRHVINYVLDFEFINCPRLVSVAVKRIDTRSSAAAEESRDEPTSNL